MRSGDRHGRLVAIELVRYEFTPGGQRRPIWLFACDCGGSTETCSYYVSTGGTRSCGCIRTDAVPSAVKPGATYCSVGMRVDPDLLAALSTDSNMSLELGKAAEHLVCANLIMSGYRCYLSDQGLPYDVIIDLGGRLVRVQVKSTCFPRNMNARGRSERVGYTFHVRKRGKNQKAVRLNESMCDIVAMVALDILAIAYLPISEVGQTCQFMQPGYVFKGAYRRTRGEPIDSFPIEAALKSMGLSQ